MTSHRSSFWGRGALAAFFSFALSSPSLLHAAPAASPRAPASPTPKPKANATYFNVLADYRAYYAELEPLCYTAIAPGTGDEFGVRFAFDSNLPGLQRIEWAAGNGSGTTGTEPDAPFRPIENKTLFVPFDARSDREQDKIIRVRPVFADGTAAPTYAIRVNWMTRAAFTAAGGHRNRDIVKITSEPRLNYGTNRPDGWKSFRPNPAETAYAQQQWGHVVAGLTSDYEKAKAITRALTRELRGCGGLPSALIYGLPTFEKYEAIRSGRSKFACAQYSEIFSKVCNVFGVINRWGFNHDNLGSDEILIELGSSHLVTEIFDRGLNQWVFLDGHAHTLGTYLGTVGPLTLHEFFLFINQPNRRPHLNVVIYDPEQDTETTLPVDQSGKAYLSYNGWTKGFHTEFRREP